MKRILGLAVLSVIGAHCSILLSQTTIIVRLKNNEFLIGADSKVSLTNGHSAACKILQGNGFWYSFVGAVEAIGSSFKADSLIENANSLPNLSTQQRIQQVDSSIQSLWKNTFSQEYSETLTVLFYHFENDTAVLTRLFYQNQPNKGLVPKNETCRFHCGYKSFGEHGAIDTLVDNPPSDMPPAPNALEYLIAKQAMATPDKVGLPVAILYLTSKGFTWYNKGLCN